MGRDCGPLVKPIARICTWSRRRDSNPEPAVYKTAALPIELRRRGAGPYRRRTLRRRGMIRSAARDGQARSGSSPGSLERERRGFRAGLTTGVAGPGKRSSDGAPSSSEAEAGSSDSFFAFADEVVALRLRGFRVVVARDGGDDSATSAGGVLSGSTGSMSPNGS